MGGELETRGTAESPSFMVWATRDPLSEPLQRLQVVKGWSDGSETHETVYDVACAGDIRPDPDTHRCPDNAARVDLSDCSTSAQSGSGELKTVWQDPDFDSTQRAFYYVRALENPTCRWSTWDALRAGVSPRSDFPTTIQERAWSSPIWLSPGPQLPARAGLDPDPSHSAAFVMMNPRPARS